MHVSFYKQLQSDFAMIRFLQYSDAFDKERYDSTVLSIREARKKITMHSAPTEKSILLYCIDTLFEFLNEGDQKKIFDFADAIHNIPEIYMQKRNLYSFRKELKKFQKKYGKQYFPFIDVVKPHFSKKAPENWAEFFSRKSDEDFKQLHPTGYKILLAAALIVLLLPMWIYLIYVVFIHPAPNEWPLALGGLGTFIFGVGLFNIVAAWIHQYLGHLLTLICLLGGTAITLFSMYLLYL